MGLLDAEETRPEPNVEGSFDCQTCDLSVMKAHLDRREGTLKWYCPNGHESLLEEVTI